MHTQVYTVVKTGGSSDPQKKKIVKMILFSRPSLDMLL